MENETKPFIWKGKKIETAGELCSALNSLTEDEAPAFRKAAEGFGPVALSNIGYCIGYLDRETRRKLYKWLDVEHPIFGKTEPTPDEAFEMGKKLGEKARKEKMT